MQELLSGEQMKSHYATGFERYASGSYAEASTLFTSLVLACPQEKKFWFALASSKQKEAKYEEALRAWALVALQEECDPLPHFHAAECLTAQGQKEEALKALEMAGALVSDNRDLKEQIAQLQRINGGHVCA